MEIVQKQGKITTYMTIDEDMLYTSRLRHSTMVRLKVALDGSISDMMAKVARIKALDDEVYKMLADTQSEE